MKRKETFNKCKIFFFQNLYVYRFQKKSESISVFDFLVYDDEQTHIHTQGE